MPNTRLPYKPADFVARMDVVDDLQLSNDAQLHPLKIRYWKLALTCGSQGAYHTSSLDLWNHWLVAKTIHHVSP